MGFAGQIFAARVAVGLAVPSSQALSSAGQTLANGIGAIYGRLNKKRISAAKERQSQAKSEMDKAQKELETFRANSGQRLRTSAQSYLADLDKNSKAVSNTIKNSANSTKGLMANMQNTLTPKLSKGLMAGVDKSMSNLKQAQQMTKNFLKMKEGERDIVRNVAKTNNEAAKQAVSDNEREQVALAGKIKKLQEQRDAYDASVKDGRKRKKAFKERIGEYEHDIDMHRKKIEALQDDSKALNENAQATKDELNVVKQLDSAIDNATLSTKDEEKALEKNAKSKEKRYNRVTKETAKVIKDASRAAADFGRKIAGNAQQLAGNFTNSLRDTIAVMTAFYYKLNQNTQELINFEKELMNANSVFNVTREELFATSNQIVQFGQEFGIEMQNGATGLYQLASAGLTAEESMAMLPHTLKLSAAVQGDHNTIAKLTTQTIAGFGMEAEDAAEITDKFAHAIQKSLIEYEDLSSAVKFALPFFTSTGQSLDQMLGALQVLTNRALEAGIAGRGLRQALSEFAESAMDAESGFRQMGVEILDAEGNMKPLTEIAAAFKAQVGESVNNTELLTTLIEGLNVRGATAFIHLVQASDEFTEAVENSKNAGGELDEMVRIQTESMAAQIQILKNNVQMMFFHADGVERANGAMNEFHSAIINGVQSLQDLFVTQVDGQFALTQFGQEIQNIAVNGINILVDLLQDAIKMVKGFTQEGLVSTDMLKLFTLPMRVTLEILQLLGPNMLKMILYFKVLNSVLPITAALTKIATMEAALFWTVATGGAILLVAGLYAVNKEFDIFNGITTDLGLEFGALAGIGKYLFEEILYPAILNTGLELIAFGAVMGFAFMKLHDAITGNSTAMWLISEAALFVYQVIKGSIVYIVKRWLAKINLIMDVIGEITELLNGNQTVWETIYNIGGHIVDYYVTMIKNLDEMLLSIDAIQFIYQPFRNMILETVDYVGDLVDGFKDLVEQLNLVEQASEGVDWLVEGGKDFLGLKDGGYVKGMSTGGMMGARRPYIVGERGPELFMPSSSGQVINNSRTENIMRQGLNAGPAIKGGAQDLVVSQLVVGNAKLKNTRMAVDSFAGVV